MLNKTRADLYRPGVELVSGKSLNTTDEIIDALWYTPAFCGVCPVRELCGPKINEILGYKVGHEEECLPYEENPPYKVVRQACHDVLSDWLSAAII